MRYLLITTVLMGSLAGFTFAQKPPVRPDDKSTIIKLEELNNQAIIKGDGKAIGDLYADDFVGIHAAGGTTNKDHLLSYYTRAGAVVSRSEEMNIRVFSDAAVVTGITVYQQSKADAVSRLRYTRVYIKRNNKWQVVSEHFTFVKGNE